MALIPNAPIPKPSPRSSRPSSYTLPLRTPPITANCRGQTTNVPDWHHIGSDVGKEVNRCQPQNSRNLSILALLSPAARARRRHVLMSR